MSFGCLTAGNLGPGVYQPARELLVPDSVLSAGPLVLNLEQSEVLPSSRFLHGIPCGRSPGGPDRDSELRVVLAPSLTAASSALALDHVAGEDSPAAKANGWRNRNSAARSHRGAKTPFLQRIGGKHDQFHRMARAQWNHGLVGEPGHADECTTGYPVEYRRRPHCSPTR